MAVGSQKQQAARERNWNIFQLRSLYSHVRKATMIGMTKEESDMMKCLVDNALKRLGAESETMRTCKMRAELLHED